MAPPLHVAFVWHMHQPYYKDDLSNTFLLPWVRLRAAKDYYRMAALLDAYPEVKVTFNLVPSLIDQLEDYRSGNASDIYLDLSRRRADELRISDRVRFLGVRRDIPALVRASVALLLPSEQEGLPRSAMESLSLGVPVIGSRSRVSPRNNPTARAPMPISSWRALRFM